MFFSTHVQQICNTKIIHFRNYALFFNITVKKLKLGKFRVLNSVVFQQLKKEWNGCAFHFVEIFLLVEITSSACYRDIGRKKYLKTINL